MTSPFAGLRTVVVGDTMLDEYVYGRATRISQEAPVMVIRQSAVSAVAGGAANVARNLVAFGATSVVIGLRGTDEAGDRLEASLADTDHLLIADSARPTTRKTRIVAQRGEQVLRIDHESTDPLSNDLSDRLVAATIDRLDGASLLLLSDYRKGTLTESSVRRLIAAAREKGVAVAANAKPETVAWYRGATIVSLNEPETEGALGRPIGDPVADAAHLRERTGTDRFLVTMGERGMATEGFTVAAVPVELADAAGAGDTTIAAVGLGIAAGLLGDGPFRFAARAAAAVVGHHGVVVPTPAEMTRILEGVS